MTKQSSKRLHFTNKKKLQVTEINKTVKAAIHEKRQETNLISELK